MSTSTYITSNNQKLNEQLFHLNQITLTTPIYTFLNQNNHILTNHLIYITTHNINNNQLTILNKKYFKNILKNHILNNNLKLLKKTKKSNHQIILLSKNIKKFITPLITYLTNTLKIPKLNNTLIYNQIKYQKHKSSNQLINPIINNHNNNR